MRKDSRIRSLRQVSAVRDLQRVAAETEAARAAATLREKNDALAASERRRQAMEDSWHAAVTGPVLQVETMPFWTAALLRQDGEARQASQATDDAKAELERRKSSWLAASRHDDIAKDLVKQAVRKRICERDEAALSAAADMHLYRRSGT